MAYFSCGITYCEQDKTSRCQTAYPCLSHSAWLGLTKTQFSKSCTCWAPWLPMVLDPPAADSLLLCRRPADPRVLDDPIRASFWIIWSSHRCLRLNNVSLMSGADRLKGWKRSNECTDLYSSRSLICFAFFHSISLYPRHTFRSNYLVFIEGNGWILKMILFHGNMVRSIMEYLAWIWAWSTSAVKSVLDFVLSAWKIVCLKRYLFRYQNIFLSTLGFAGKDVFMMGDHT